MLQAENELTSMIRTDHMVLLKHKEARKNNGVMYLEGAELGTLGKHQYEHLSS